jgi:hypothetical protein
MVHHEQMLSIPRIPLSSVMLLTKIPFAPLFDKEMERFIEPSMFIIYWPAVGKIIPQNTSKIFATHFGINMMTSSQTTPRSLSCI